MGIYNEMLKFSFTSNNQYFTIMTTIYDSDSLITTTNGQLYLDLQCGYGQPCVTTVYHLRNDNSTVVLDTFTGGCAGRPLGNIAGLKYSRIVVVSTIQDVMDSTPNDIAYAVKVNENGGSSCDTRFTKSTVGKGAIFRSEYTVAIY